MQQNPYSAPRTRLQDAPRRPLAVKLAAAAVACSFLAGYTKFLFIKVPTTGLTTGIAFAIVFGLGALLLAAVLSRINWARWIVAVLLSANLALILFAIWRISLSAVKLVLLAQAFFQLAALVLMFLPQSAKWYRPNNSSKPTPLRGAA